MIKKVLQVGLLSSLIIFPNVIEADAATPSQIESQAHKYIGIPYKYGGTTTSGFDCSGYVQQVFQDLNVSIPRDTKSQYKVGQTVSKSNLAVGDLVFFNTSGSGVSHVGIYIGSNNFIHAATSKGVSVSSINDPYYWGSKYIGAKRVLADEPKVKEVVKEEVKAATIDMTIFASRAEVAKSIAAELKLPAATSTFEYTDVNKSSEYYDAINTVTAAKIFSGNEQGKFNPSKPITRAHVAKVLVQAFDLKPAKGNYTFKDVSKTHWANEYVQILAQNGITIGKPNGTYGINDNVTYTQMKTFMDRVKNLK